MRTASRLLVPAIFLILPIFVQAADLPSLTVYTLSHSTIYPDAAVDSGLATTTTIDVAFSEAVKVSIKIMSAAGVTIKSLYSSSNVTNPTSKVWDSMNNAGTRVDDGMYTILISATSTATNQSMTDSSKTITVTSSGGSDSSDPDPTPSDTSSDATDTTETGALSSDGGPTEYLPIPTLRIISDGDRTISSGAEVAFTAAVYDDKGNKRNDAVVTWSFGDGMRRTGASVFHSYYESGEYLAIVRAVTSDGGDAMKEMILTVKDASIKIVSVSARGITLANNDSRILDLSLWRLLADGKEFKIPENTHILAGHTVLFPSQVIELPVTDTASLLYPNGEVAFAYPAIAVAVNTTVFPSVTEQPFSGAVSYKKIQVVEPITSTQTNSQEYEEAVIAPTAATELAAVGAVLSPLLVGASTSDVGATPAPRFSGIFHSPWTLGLLGVIIAAGGAFILL